MMVLLHRMDRAPPETAPPRAHHTTILKQSVMLEQLSRPFAVPFARLLRERSFPDDPESFQREARDTFLCVLLSQISSATRPRTVHEEL